MHKPLEFSNVKTPYKYHVYRYQVSPPWPWRTIAHHPNDRVPTSSAPASSASSLLSNYQQSPDSPSPSPISSYYPSTPHMLLALSGAYQLHRSWVKYVRWPTTPRIKGWRKRFRTKFSRGEGEDVLLCRESQVQNAEKRWIFGGSVLQPSGQFKKGKAEGK